MSKDFAQIADDVIAGLGTLRQGSPDTMKAFTAVAVAATTTHAIDTKTKELMALAIGSLFTVTVASLTTRRWHINTEPRGKRSRRRWPWLYTWAEAQPTSTARMP
jgi:hypothetical protein